MTGAQSFRISGRFYPVYAGTGIFHDLENFLASSFPSSGVFILADENVSSHCLPLLLEKCPALETAPVFILPPGEKSKDISRVVEVWNWLASLNAERTDLLINLGGGVVTDLGGFISGTFKRGMAFVNIPTTLIGQADASLGGKSGINVSNVKNQAGLFYNPSAVFIYPDFLKTLPSRELRAGYAEIIKSALITGGEFWEQVRKPGALEKIDMKEIVQKSAMAKLAITDNDPLDQGQRKALNFGHTIGHALESWSFEPGRKQLLHGEAVAAGMVCESYLSVLLTGLDPGIEELLRNLVNEYFDQVDIGEKDIEEILDLINQDKKIREGLIKVPLIKAPGKVLMDQQVAPGMIREALLHYQEKAG